MRNHKRDGKITILELLIIAAIFVLGYFVVFSPLPKIDDMIKEEWVKNNLGTIYDAVEHFQKQKTFSCESMTLNEVDILRANMNPPRPPLEWPNGVDFDSFKVNTNCLSITIKLTKETRVVTYSLEDRE